MQGGCRVQGEGVKMWVQSGWGVGVRTSCSSRSLPCTLPCVPEERAPLQTHMCVGRTTVTVFSTITGHGCNGRAASLGSTGRLGRGQGD